MRPARYFSIIQLSNARYNPSFDVTDHSLITAIVTEKGVCYPPYTESLAKLF